MLRPCHECTMAGLVPSDCLGQRFPCRHTPLNDFNTQRMLSQYVLNAYYPQLGNGHDRERARPAMTKTPVANPA